MNSIESNFVPYQIALDMKSIGFDEPCFGRYIYDGRGKEWFLVQTQQTKNASVIFKGDISVDGISIAAPLYQQAFRWFRDKYELDVEIERKWRYSSNHNPTETFIRYSIYNFKLDRESKEYILFISKDDFNTYEEAEFECLKKLIEIVKEK